MTLLLALLAACTPTAPADGKDEPTPPVVDTDLPDPPTPPTDDTAADRPEPSCDGLDDDADGVVDDGFTDADADGHADCVDTCQTRLPPAGPAAFHRCAPPDFSPHPDPWRAEVAWTWRGDAAGRSAVATTPVVGQLTDDNGDGRIDRRDAPDVAFIAGATLFDRYATLVILDGATGATHAELPDFAMGPGAELGYGDVDDDGVPELLATRSDSHHVAIRADGSVAWTTPDRVDWPVLTSVTRTFDVPDVAVDNGWLDGRDGHRLAVATPNLTMWAGPWLADLDGDGLTDWLVGDALYTAAGQQRFAVPDAPNSMHQSVPFEVDDAPGPELLFLDDGLISARGRDGVTLWNLPASVGQRPGPASVGDLDGDGLLEVAFIYGSELWRVQPDGAVPWRVPVRDASCCAGVLTADLDGDGAAEVVLADEVAVRVVDGRTGAERLRLDWHRSQTINETPAVADLDGDGSLELIFGSNSDDDAVPGGLTVVRHPDRGWAPASRGWGGLQHDRASVREDGAVVVSPETGARATTGVRSADTWAVAEAPHHHLALLSSCPSDDGATRRGVVQVANRGGASSAAAWLELVHRTADGDEVLSRVAIPALPEGRALPAWSVDVPAARFATGQVLSRIVDGATACGPPQTEVVWPP